MIGLTLNKHPSPTHGETVLGWDVIRIIGRKLDRVAPGKLYHYTLDCLVGMIGEAWSYVQLDEAEVYEEMEHGYYIIAPDNLDPVASHYKIKDRDPRVWEYKPPRDLIDAPEAAQILGCCTRTVFRYAKDGHIKRIMLGPRRVRFDRDEVIDFHNHGMTA